MNSINNEKDINTEDKIEEIPLGIKYFQILCPHKTCCRRVDDNINSNGNSRCDNESSNDCDDSKQLSYHTDCDDNFRISVHLCPYASLVHVKTS